MIYAEKHLASTPSSHFSPSEWNGGDLDSLKICCKCQCCCIKMAKLLILRFSLVEFCMCVCVCMPAYVCVFSLPVCGEGLHIHGLPGLSCCHRGWWEDHPHWLSAETGSRVRSSPSHSQSRVADRVGRWSWRIMEAGFTENQRDAIHHWVRGHLLSCLTHTQRHTYTHTHTHTHTHAGMHTWMHKPPHT